MRPLIAILIGALVFLLILHAGRWWLRGGREGFADQTLDAPAYLAALAEYNAFFTAQGYKTCKSTATANPYCASYGGQIGPAYAYSPPIIQGLTEFSARVATYNTTYRGDANPVAVVAPPGPAPADFAPLAVAIDQTYTPGILFTLYTTRPSPQENFQRRQAATPLEKLLDSLVTLSVRDANTLSPAYTTVLTVGGERYKFRKVFDDMAGENPQRFSGVLGIKREFESGPEICVATRDTAATRAFRNIAGTQWESSADLLGVMLAARGQDDLNARLASPVVTAAAGAAAVGGAAGAAATAAARQPADQIQIPAVTYYEDAWLRNRALFDKMYRSIENPPTAVKTYYQGAKITQGESYERTALRFMELDKRILAVATVNGRVQPAKLKRGDGTVYKFEIPYPYDPQLQVFGAEVEDPSLPAIDLKCFKVTPGLQKLKNYFGTERTYEDPRMSNKECLAKIQENLCASYGYVTKNGVPKCECDGCCIPVAYKKQAKVGVDLTAKLVGAADEDLTGVDNCIHFNTMYTLKRAPRVLGEAEECAEGFYGGGEEESPGLSMSRLRSAAGPTMAQLRSTADIMKGWKIFGARAPIIMGFTGSGTGAANGCKVAEYRLERAPLNFVKC